jgi:hypothetical protein
VHTLVGAGSTGRGTSGSGLDVSNLMKPALARGELQVRAGRRLGLRAGAGAAPMVAASWGRRRRGKGCAGRVEGTVFAGP